MGRWDFWWRWVLSNFVGSAAGWGAAALAFLLVGFSDAESETYVGRSVFLGGIGVGFGLAIGWSQNLVLKRFVGAGSKWLLATVLGFGVGLAFTGVLESAISLAVGGLIGFAIAAAGASSLQWWLVLRSRISGSWWWVLAGALAFYVGVVAAVGTEPAIATALGLAKPAALSQSTGGVAFATIVGSIVGLVYGILSGAALVVIARGKLRSSLVAAVGQTSVP